MIGLLISFASVAPSGSSVSRATGSREVTAAGDPARLNPESYLGPNFRRENKLNAPAEDATDANSKRADSKEVKQVRGERQLADLGGTRLAILHEVARAA